MYHSESAKSVIVAVMHTLSNENGTVRRVFATQSLSMGVNCRNIREIVFWGPPKNLEEYFQECGRAGRDQLASTALLLFSSSQLHRCTNEMKLLCTGNGCMRHMVLKYYGYDSACLQRSLICCTICSN